MIELIKKLNKPRPLILSGSAALLMLVYFDMQTSTVLPEGAPGVMALQLAFTPQVFSDILSIWGQEGIRVYLDIMWVDYFFPLAYAFFFANCVSLLISNKEQTKEQAYYFGVLPFIAGLMDYIENSLHIVQFNNLDKLSSSLIWLASLAALIKWVLLGVVLLVIVYYGAHSMQKLFDFFLDIGDHHKEQ